MVHNALISGVTPVLSCVYTLIGSVDRRGPFTKILITTSSIDMANASSEPEITAGIIKGSVISRKALNGPAPRSLAASSSAGSMPASLAFTSIRI